MKESLLDLPFPLGGLNQNTAVDRQPPGTTPRAVNVRGYDPTAGRDRGGQRSGLVKYCPDQVSGDALVQDINQAVHGSPVLPPIPTASGSIGFIGIADPTIAQGFQLYNHTAGTLTPYLESFTDPECLGVCWDLSGNLYALLASPGSYYILSLVGETGAQRWLSLALGTTTKLIPSGICFGNGSVWVAVSDNPGTNTYLYELNAATGAVVPGAAAAYRFTTTRVLSAASGSPVNPSSVVAYCAGLVAIGCASGYVVLYNANTDTSLEVLVQASGPATVGVASDGSSSFYVASRGLVGSWMTRLDINGVEIWQTGTGNTKIAGVIYDPYHLVAVAHFLGDLTWNWVTYEPATGNLTGTNVFTNNSTDIYFLGLDGTGGYVVFAAGNVLASITTANGTNWSTTYAGSSGVQFAACLSTTGSLGGSSTAPLSHRSLRSLAVAAGTVVRFDTQAAQTVTNGSGALSPGPPVIFSSQLGTALYFVDGVHYKYYDCPTDSILTLTASVGELPRDDFGNPPRLVAVWRNRLVFAIEQDWFMSAVFDATDWDYNPDPSVETQAVAGNNITAGQNPDIIQALVPYTDEILLFGGDHSLYQLTGDPMAGGRIDLITDSIGMAWGRPFCRDSQGSLYFVSSRGSCYQFVPGAIPQKLSDPISELLADLQADTQIVRMAWDERQSGFHLWITTVTGRAATFHYFYDVRNKAWWQDEYANTRHNPVAVHAHEGDLPGSRLLLLGGWDGYIRALDPLAKDDDGTAIASEVFLGPLRDKGRGGTTLADLQCTLDTDSDQVGYQVFTGESAQAALLSQAQTAGIFLAGRNHSQAVRVFGHALFVRLFNSDKDSNWQLECLQARARFSSGKARQRIF